MKCPRCKTEHKTLGEKGDLVSRQMDICIMCGFIFKSVESYRFADRCAEMIQRHITSYKNTKNVDFIRRADIYLQALKEEVGDG